MKPILSPRQREIIRLIANGEPDKVIAERLGISQHTVTSHVTLLLSRLNAKSRSHAVYLFFCQ